VVAVVAVMVALAAVVEVMAALAAKAPLLYNTTTTNRREQPLSFLFLILSSNESLYLRGGIGISSSAH
jgi:hypothetical protein